MIPMGFLFWILWILCLLFSTFGYRLPDGKWNWAGAGVGLVVYLLIGLLGWKVFGFPIGH